MNYEAITTDPDVIVGDVSQVHRNIIGWYLYLFSSEPFIVSAIATYVPVLLEQFARLNGVTVHDHSKPCTPADAKCVLPMFNETLFIDSSSFALYTFSLSVFCQALIVISVSGVVDMCKTVSFKRQVLLFFGVLGAVNTILISRLHFTQYYSLALLSILANCCYGVINVVGNSLLPMLVDDLKTLTNSYRDVNRDQLTSTISGRGSGFGYIAALYVQVCCFWLVKSSKSKENIQVAVLFVGIWWLLFQLPMSWMLQDVRLVNTPRVHQFQWRQSTKYLKYGWKSLSQSCRHAKLLKDVLIFLLGWFIISDSITTINSTAILFSKTELHMSLIGLILISIITMLSAIFGAFFIPQFLSQKLKVSSQRTLIYIICWSSLIPLYGILGFVFTNIGLKTPFEMYLLAVWYGISLGGLAAVSRTVFTLIIPKGMESTFFSLFSLTDKGSSILGPLLVGLITDKTHNIRYSFYLLFAFLVISLPIFNALDVERGKREASELTDLQDE